MQSKSKAVKHDLYLQNNLANKEFGNPLSLKNRIMRSCNVNTAKLLIETCDNKYQSSK